MPFEDDLFALKDRYETDSAIIRREIDVLKRKSRGISGANRRAAALEIVMSKVESRLEKLEAKSSGGGVTPNTLFELEQIRKEVTRYRGEIDGLDARVSVLEQSDANKIDFKNSKIEVAHASEIKPETPWVEALIVAVVAAFLTAFSLNFFIARDWNIVKDFWASIIIGTAVFFIYASFEKWVLMLKIQARHNWAWKDQNQPMQVEDVVSIEEVNRERIAS